MNHTSVCLVCLASLICAVDSSIAEMMMATSENLAITEVHYNPRDPDADELLVDRRFDDDDFEFLEFQNTGDQMLDLTGVKITDGVSFDFADSEVTTLPAGDFVVVVRDLAAFEARYGTGLNVAGEYRGSLSNGGETITTMDARREEINDFSYDDGPLWPAKADGGGSSLMVLSTAGDYNDPANWQASFTMDGTPAVPEPSTNALGILGILLFWHGWRRRSS